MNSSVFKMIRVVAAIAARSTDASPPASAFISSGVALW
jgi:hypothetical protein